MKIGPAVRPGRRIEKKKQGQDRTQQSKKSQGGNISPIWGEAPTVPIETKICMVDNLADVITCAKFQDEIFTGYDFTGVKFPIFLLIFARALQQCSATELPVISSYTSHRNIIPTTTSMFVRSVSRMPLISIMPRGSFRLAPALAVVLLSTMHNKEEINTESEKRSHR